MLCSVELREQTGNPGETRTRISTYSFSFRKRGRYGVKTGSPGGSQTPDPSGRNGALCSLSYGAKMVSPERIELSPRR